MTNTENYQGWTNHATWAVNLHIGNDQGTYLYFEDVATSAVRDAKREYDNEKDIKFHATVTVADAVKDFVDEQYEKVFDNLSTFAFMLMADLCEKDNANWWEIAEGLLEEKDFAPDTEDDDDEEEDENN